MTNPPAPPAILDELASLLALLESVLPFTLPARDELAALPDWVEAVAGGAGNPIPRGCVEVVGRVAGVRVAMVRPSSATGPFAVPPGHAQHLRALVRDRADVSPRERNQVEREPLLVDVDEVHRCRLDVRAAHVEATRRQVRAAIERLRSELPGEGDAWARLAADDLLTDATVEPVRALLRRCGAAGMQHPPRSNAPAAGAPLTAGAPMIKPGEIRATDICWPSGARVHGSTLRNWTERGTQLDGKHRKEKLDAVRRLPGGERVFLIAQVARFVEHSWRGKQVKGRAL